MRSIHFGRRYIRLRGPVQLRIDVRNFVVTAIFIGAAIVIGLFGLMVGTLPVSFQQVFGALFGQETGMVRTVVIEWRLPRVLSAIIFGAALAVSGTIFQSLTKNPLGSPDIIGFSAGSYTGVLIVLLIFSSTSFISVAVGALIGGFTTALLIYLLSFRKGTEGFRFVIVGISIAAILGSVNSMLLLRSEAEVALTAAAWGIGSLNGVDWKYVFPAIIFVLILLLCAGTMMRPLRENGLGEDAAKSHGVRVERTQFILIFVAVALTAVPTAVMGPVSFVALAAPQIAQRFTKSASSLLPEAAMGSFILIGADVLAQRVIPGMIFPVGVVTLSLGGIYLVWLLFRQARANV